MRRTLKRWGVWSAHLLRKWAALPHFNERQTVVACACWCLLSAGLMSLATVVMDTDDFPSWLLTPLVVLVVSFTVTKYAATRVVSTVETKRERARHNDRDSNCVHWWGDRAGYDHLKERCVVCCPRTPDTGAVIRTQRTLRLEDFFEGLHDALSQRERRRYR